MWLKPRRFQYPDARLYGGQRRVFPTFLGAATPRPFYKPWKLGKALQPLICESSYWLCRKNKPWKEGELKLIPGREAEFNGVWAGFLGRDLELSLKGGPGKTG